MTNNVSYSFKSPKFLLSLVVGGRSPKLQENTTNILSEDSIKVYLTYLDQLKTLFTQFVHKNFNAKKKVRLQALNSNRLPLSDSKLERDWGEKDLDGCQRLPQNV